MGIVNHGTAALGRRLAYLAWRSCRAPPASREPPGRPAGQADGDQQQPGADPAERPAAEQGDLGGGEQQQRRGQDEHGEDPHAVSLTQPERQRTLEVPAGRARAGLAGSQP